ncbi:MAG: DUF401 family protein [Thermoplasmatota archaeon]
MLNIFGVIIAFLVVILLIRKKINFGISLLIGSLILGLFSLQIIEPIQIPKAIIQASFYSFTEQQFFTETLELGLLMTIIFILAKSMKETKAITKLIESLQTFFSNGGTLGVIPAVYGLMPIPGGALFSAPLIHEEGEKFHLDKNKKNFLNVWFRHIWFPIYPISSAMILLCSEKFSNINIYHLVLYNIPAFIISISIGLWYLKKFIKRTTMAEENLTKNYKGLIYLIPPIFPLIIYAILQPFGIPQIRSFLIGIICSIIILYFLISIPIKEYLQIIKKSITWKLMAAIFGIMIFREMFDISQANTLLIKVIESLPIAPLLLIILVPFLFGILTGYNLGAIALSYFFIQPFFEFTGLNIISLSSIIFISSLAGYLISPIHLCNVLSSEYLQTDTTRMYKIYLPAVFVLLFSHTFFIIIISLI